MLTLCIRTDKPEAELYVFDGNTERSKVIWQAHRQLADTIHEKIDEVLEESGHSLKGIERIVIFEGSGSFTGLRIGFSVANAIGYSQNIPVIATGSNNWIEEGLQSKIKEFIPAKPVYGGKVHVTKQKK